jgi:hypothetical protein
MASKALETEIGHGNTGLIRWSAFGDVDEPVPELAFPNSVTTYSRMRTDAQIASLLLAFTLPIRRYRWYVSPNGARDEVVEDVASNLSLPIEGQDDALVGRRRDRFSHDRHLFHALLNLVYGFMFSAPLVFRSFLTLPLVRGSRGHAGDAWFVDLGG